MRLRLTVVKLTYLLDLLRRDYYGSLYFYSFNPHTKERVDRVVSNIDGSLSCKIISGKDFFILEGPVNIDSFKYFLVNNKVYWEKIELSSQTFSEFMYLFVKEATQYETYTGQRLARYMF